MTPDRWRQIRGVLEDALALPADERRRFVEVSCGGDHALREEVESLLTAHQGAGSFLESPAAAPGGSPAVPDRIGTYRIAGEIGRGGMGTVYRAERADGAFDKAYALKLVPRELATEEFVRRFREERQILAALDHPGIARLIDGGTAADGRPYLVMEYIAGEPIDRYCAGRRLSLRRRLELFVKVCDIVSFAHSNLVVHRDLKPQNILVQEEGEPRLLDFGIAKLLTAGEEAPTAVGLTTVPGRVPLTPEYASPEQALAEPVSTASDVYSLGVLLFELLTGERPYRITGRAPDQVARQLANVEPEPPSRLVARRGRETAAAHRPWRERFGQQRRRLPRDLDHIVLKALRREPRRRYSGAGQMSEDLQRFLSGRPVEARPDSLGYRTGRFVSRHKLAVTVAASALLILLAGLVTLAVQRTQILAERRAAQEVSRFLVDLFKVSDPAQSRGATITAREVLDLGSRRISHELAAEPLLRADLESTLGDVYAKLGLAEEAQSHFDRVLEILRQAAPDDDRRIALGLWGRGRALALKGDHAAAKRWFNEAIALQRRLPRRQGSDLAGTLVDLGYLLVVDADYAGAEPLLQEALTLAAGLGEEGRTAQVAAYRAMGTLRREQALYEPAQAAYEKALALVEERDAHPDTAGLLADFGNLLSRRGDLGGAEAMLRRALAMERELYPPQHPELPVAIGNLALVLQARGHFREAEVLQREALAIATKVFGDDTPEVALPLHNLAAVLAAQGDLDSAEALYRRSLEITRRISPGHPGVGSGLNNLATIFQQRGDYREAKRYYLRAIALQESNFGPVHPEVFSPVRNLGNCLLEMGRPAEAAPLLHRALDIARQALGERHPYTGLALLSVGRLETARGNLETATTLLDSAFDVLGSAPPPRFDRYVAETLEAQAKLALLRGDPTAAVTLGRQAVALYEQLYPEGHLRLTRAQLHLAEGLQAGQRPDEARAVLDEACAAGRRLPAWAADVLAGCAGQRRLERPRGAAAVPAAAAGSL
jgi:eukaryotic-like serine/threonine-protein kinase